MRMEKQPCTRREFFTSSWTGSAREPVPVSGNRTAESKKQVYRIVEKLIGQAWGTRYGYLNRRESTFEIDEVIASTENGDSN